MKRGIIYMARCKVNNKIYIGKTIQTLHKRKINHKASLNYTKRKHNFKFYNAIKKHGWDNFEWNIIEYNIPEKSLNEKEIYYINEYNSFENGYNTTKGGDGLGSGKNHPMYGKKHTEESKEKMRKSHHNLKGENHPCFGRKHTEDELIKMRGNRENIKGKNNPMYGKTGSKNPNYNSTVYHFSHPVHGEVSCTTFELRQKYDLHQSNLSSLVNGRLRSYKKWTVTIRDI